MNIYIYPLRIKTTTSNPFMDNFVDSLRKVGANITNKKPKKGSVIVNMVLHHNTDTDAYILNWIEETPNYKFGFSQSILFIIFFYIQILRGKKFVWVCHNIVSHSKDNFLNKCIRAMLKRKCDLFITLSREAQKKISNDVNKKVLFFNHPINSNLLKLETKPATNHYDILIWGSILKYKGIVEFLQHLHDKCLEAEYKIFIIGKCKDTVYEEQLLSLCNDNIIFHNSYVDFSELKGYIANSRYVLFPYIGESTSSSGALIDTITMGGCSIGPNKGAFADLAKDNVCLTYTDYDSLIEIISSEQTIATSKIEKFIENNSWNNFANCIHHEILSL